MTSMAPTRNLKTSWISKCPKYQKMKGLSNRSPKKSRLLWCRPAHRPPWALSTEGATYRILLISPKHPIPSQDHKGMLWKRQTGLVTSHHKQECRKQLCPPWPFTAQWLSLRVGQAAGSPRGELPPTHTQVGLWVSSPTPTRAVLSGWD